MSDIPSQYAKEVETFRQILDLPDPGETLPRSSTTLLGLDDEKGQQELRPRGPSAMLPLNPILKDAFEKFEQDFLASNLPECKYIKPPASTAKYYKVGQPCFENKLQELYTMGNTGLLRREAEMTLLQPHLGHSRLQKLRNSPFWPTPLFKSQLVKDGEDFLLKKGTPKDSQGFRPYQNKPFRGPHHNKKRGSYRKRPYGGNSSQSSNQSFSSGRGNRTSEAPGVVFDLTKGDEGF